MSTKTRIRLPSILSAGTTASSGKRRQPASQAARILRPDFVVSDKHRDRAAKLFLAGDPEQYLFEIFGWRLARDQKRAVTAYLENSRLLLVGANGTGKSALLHALALGWSWDAGGSIPGEDGTVCRGGILLLIAPKETAIKEAYQKHFLTLGRRARDRGHLMPGWGQHSMRSADWQAIEGEWYIKGITASREAAASTGGEQDRVAHSVLGAHHDNLIVLIDEGTGVPLPIIEAAKGRLRGADNKLVLSSNPTAAMGNVYKFDMVDGWPVVYSSAVGRLAYDDKKGGGGVVALLPHENIQARKAVFPGCVNHLRVEEDLRDRSLFENRGILWQGEGDPPDGHARVVAASGDVPYALPSARVEDKPGPRKDGFPGHPDAPVQVLRPLTGLSYGRLIGGWPPKDPFSLFSEMGLLAAIQVREGLVPEGSPRVVGIDASTSERGDEMVATPWWGLPARELIELAWRMRPNEGSSIYAGAELVIKLSEIEPGKWAIEKNRKGIIEALGIPAGAGTNLGPVAGVPAYVGEPVSLSVAEKGAVAARTCLDRWGTEPVYHLDPAHGAEIGSYLLSAGCTVMFMYFGSQTVMLPVPGQKRAPLNTRAMWAFDLADAIDLGLVGMCRDEQTRGDLIALGPPIEVQKAAVRMVGTGGKIGVYKLREKSEIKIYLGRSPDRGDSLKLASAKPPLGEWD